MKNSLSIAFALSAAMSLGACCQNSANCPPCSKGSAPAAADEGAAVVATYAGKQMTMAELDKLTAQRIYELRMQAIEEKVLTDLVETEAKKAGKDAESFLRGIIEEAAKAPIPEEQLKQAYEQLKPRLGDKTFDEVKPMLEEMMRQGGQKEALAKYIDALKQSAQMKILLEEPKIVVNVEAVGPSKGPENAPVTIIEFSDFECPYCSRAAKTIEQLFNNNAGRIRLVFRSYPLPFHPNAKKAAEAGLCANEQGKFWQLHDAMFADQENLGVDAIKAKAAAAGLDAAAFATCLDSGKFAAQVEADMKVGAEAGVEGTPVFIINGQLISGSRSPEEFQKIIDQAAAKK